MVPSPDLYRAVYGHGGRSWAYAVQLGAGGSVVANAGFIKQFGTEAGAGVRALDPTWCKKSCICESPQC